MIKDAVKSVSTVDKDWISLTSRIEGVQVKEIRCVPTSRSLITEIFHAHWDFQVGPIQRIIQAASPPQMINAWHMHQYQSDILSCVQGHLTLALFDDRESSSTHGQVDVFHLSDKRPTTVLIPPKVWHGFKTIGNEYSIVINFFDNEFNYDDPDEWHLPHGHPDIPYSFD